MLKLKMSTQRIQMAEAFRAQIHELTYGLSLPATPRNRAAGACFAIAQDHHAAIVFLLKNTFYSSSYALLRCLFEAYLRGLWLKHCATDLQLADFINGVEPPKTMLSEIEATEVFSSGALSRVKKTSWRTMCAFTHTGGLHLQRWQSPTAIEPVFETGELEECLNCAELLGCMSGLELVQMSNTSDNGVAVIDLMKKGWPQ